MLNNNFIREIKTKINEKGQLRFYKEPNWKTKRQLWLFLPEMGKDVDNKDICFYKVVNYRKGQKIDLEKSKDEFAYDIAFNETFMGWR